MPGTREFPRERRPRPPEKSVSGIWLLPPWSVWPLSTSRELLSGGQRGPCTLLALQAAKESFVGQRKRARAQEQKGSPMLTLLTELRTGFLWNCNEVLPGSHYWRRKDRSGWRPRTGLHAGGGPLALRTDSRAQQTSPAELCRPPSRWASFQLGLLPAGPASSLPDSLGKGVALLLPSGRALGPGWPL